MIKSDNTNIKLEIATLKCREWHRDRRLVMLVLNSGYPLFLRLVPASDRAAHACVAREDKDD